MVRGFVGLTFDVPDKLAAALTDGASLPNPKPVAPGAAVKAPVAAPANAVAKVAKAPVPGMVVAAAHPIQAPQKVFVAGKH